METHGPTPEADQAEPTIEHIEDKTDEQLMDEAGDLLRERAQLAQAGSKLQEEPSEGGRVEELTHRINQERENIRHRLLVESGLAYEPGEEALRRMERAKQDFGDPEAALVDLGILEEQEGVLRFSYPDGLFATDTDDRWEEYIKSVRGHMEAVDQAKQGEAGNDDLASADKARVAAHDKFTRSLVREFNLEPTKESFEQCRRLAAKMRDSLVPNTGELQLTADNVKQMFDAHISDLESRKALNA